MLDETPLGLCRLPNQIDNMSQVDALSLYFWMTKIQGTVHLDDTIL